MSVYTPISASQLESLLKQFHLGQLHQFAGIQDGIENTNYSVETNTGNYILTIYEELKAPEIEAVIKLLQLLNKHHYPAPVAQVDNQGSVLTLCQQKPAAFFRRLPGHSVTHPNHDQCRKLGIKLAQLHNFSKNTTFKKNNRKNLQGCRAIFQKLLETLSAQDAEIIQNEISFQTDRQSPDLPSGLIHADLFRDNVLFSDNHISGILDFYTACQDALILDLAIACNDWCIADGRADLDKMRALLTGYQRIRTLTNPEQRLFNVYLRFAALRFWISRLHRQSYPLEGEIIQQKDPEVFRHILQQHIQNPVQL